MNSNATTKSREKSIKSFIFRCVSIQFIITLVLCTAYPQKLFELVQDKSLGPALLTSAFWNVIGIAFYPYLSLSNRIAHDVQKILILALFFAPTFSILIFGPMLNEYNSSEMPKISTPFQEVPPIRNSKPIFFARTSIARGEAITAKNTIVVAADPEEYVGGIIATKQNHFGDSKNKDSMLLRKCIYPIEGGSPIRDSDIEPHYQ